MCTRVVIVDVDVDVAAAAAAAALKVDLLDAKLETKNWHSQRFSFRVSFLRSCLLCIFFNIKQKYYSS